MYDTTPSRADGTSLYQKHYIYSIKPLQNTFSCSGSSQPSCHFHCGFSEGTLTHINSYIYLFVLCLSANLSFIATGGPCNTVSWLNLQLIPFKVPRAANCYPTAALAAMMQLSKSPVRRFNGRSHPNPNYFHVKPPVSPLAHITNVIHESHDEGSSSRNSAQSSTRASLSGIESDITTSSSSLSSFIITHTGDSEIHLLISEIHKVMNLVLRSLRLETKPKQRNQSFHKMLFTHVPHLVLVFTSSLR